MRSASANQKNKKIHSFPHLLQKMLEKKLHERFLRKFFVSDIEKHLHIESKYGALFFKANLLKGRQKISEKLP